MQFFKRSKEAIKIRETLSANGLPVDESIFCAALSSGRVKSFDKLNNAEFQSLKRSITGLTHEQLIEGIYSIAIDLKVISNFDMNDNTILEYLKNMEVLNQKYQFELQNAKGVFMTFFTPFKKQSYYANALLSLLFGGIYLKRSAIVN